MKYDLYDTNGRVRKVTTVAMPDAMRILISKFKTHCMVEGSAYEFNHFVNWAKKYHGITISYVDDTQAIRLDM